MYQTVSAECGCNDYSLLAAKTGIANLSIANPNLDGTGALVTVLTAGPTDGTRIKSIIIKAAQPTKTGMVRLFIRNAAGSRTTLYREIPLSENPMLTATPTPTPILPMIEVDLMDGLELEPNASLLASTQNAEKINVIAEAVSWDYPSTLPDTCCNFKQSRAMIGNGTASVANTNLDGSGTIVTLFTAPAAATANGALIKSITLSALQSTHEGMVRLFISPPGSPTFSLWMEINVPETTQSGFQPSYKQVFKEDFCLEAEYVIGASTHLAESFAITVEGNSWTYPIS
ncbi:MAG: hypothetical protein JNL72_08470 [Flavipsychrobacter sp.]|nr:hypothetical protein [Flavipsychrobacter sp.]